MQKNEILAWFEVMGVVPTTAEYIKARDIFDNSICLDPDFRRDDESMILAAPLVRADQFRKFSSVFYKNLKWWHWLRFVPGVRGVALNNKAAFMASNIDSDIDIFIVAKKNTVWLTRGLVTMLAILLKARRTDKNFAGKWCLPFFLEENIPVQSLALETTDPELLWWENNLLWLVAPFVIPVKTGIHYSTHPHLCHRSFNWRLYSVIAKPFNHLAYIWQKKIFLRYDNKRSEIKETRNEMRESIIDNRKSIIDTREGIVLTPQVAKFYTIDRRREHAEAWKKLCLNS